MADWLKVAKHGILGGWPVQVPHLQQTEKYNENDKIQTMQVTRQACYMHVNTLSHLDIQKLVVGAGRQQESSCCVGKLTVVDLLLMLLLKDSQQLDSLHIPHLTDTQFQERVMSYCCYNQVGLNR